MSGRLLQQVHLIGCGVIGTSIALDLIDNGSKVSLEDSFENNLATAVKLGAGVAEVPVSPDVVLIAVPPSQVSEVVIACLAKFPEALIVDVASVKAPIRMALEASGVDSTRYISTHPLAGKELTGPENASRGLFENKVWAVLKEQDQTPEIVLKLIQLLGAKPVFLTDLDHDKAVALTSHTPQLLATVLAAIIAEADDAELSLSGQGLLDMIRIAGSDANLWADIVTMNSENILESIQAVQAKLNNLVKILENSDSASAKAELTNLIQQGNSGLAKIKQIQDGKFS